MRLKTYNQIQNNKKKNQTPIRNQLKPLFVLLSCYFEEHFFLFFRSPIETT